MEKKRNPWFLLACWMVGIPLVGCLFLAGILLSMGGGADLVPYFVFPVVLIFVIYKAVRYNKRQKESVRPEE